MHFSITQLITERPIDSTVLPDVVDETRRLKSRKGVSFRQQFPPSAMDHRRRQHAPDSVCTKVHGEGRTFTTFTRQNGAIHGLTESQCHLESLHALAVPL